MRLGKILKSKIYWQTIANRINKYDMKNIICKKCGGNQCYKQLDEVNWIICPNCNYKERIKNYFNNHKNEQ